MTVSIPPVDGPPWPQAAAAVFDTVAARGGTPPELYRVLANAPELLAAWTAFAWPLRERCHTPRGLRELVVLRVSQLTGAHYEWVHHKGWAIEHGVRPAQLAALADWRSSAEFDAAQRAVLAATDELTVDGALADERRAGLAAHYDDRDVVELVLTISFYCCVSRVLAGLDIGIEPEHTETGNGRTP
jgi:4-carboxymuconolactone decarboxylase